MVQVINETTIMEPTPRVERLRDAFLRLKSTASIERACIETRIMKDGDVKRLADMVRTFIDQKIFHMQINVVSSDTLRAAQNEPEKYRDLVVKVAGYNAFFTQLSTPLQDSIIARTEHGL